MPWHGSRAHENANGNLEYIYNVGDDIPGLDQWGFKLTMTLLFPK
jgi:hypothetical protein